MNFRWFIAIPFLLLSPVSAQTIIPTGGGGGGAVTPGGTTGSVQYNNAGAFGGATNILTDGAGVLTNNSASGRVNIGVNAATAVLPSSFGILPHIVQTDESPSGEPGWWLGTYGDNDPHESVLYFARAGGTVASPSDVWGDANGAILSLGYVGGGVGWANFAEIEFGNAEGNPTDGSHVFGRIQFSVANANSDGPHEGMAVNYPALQLTNDYPAHFYHVGESFVGEANNPTNYERGALLWHSSPDYWTIATQGGGTGTARPIAIAAGGTTPTIYFQASLRPQANGLNLTADGAVTGTVYTRFYVPSATTGLLAFDDTSSNSVTLGLGGGTNTLGIGGKTSSFPALHASGAVMQIRLADNSAYARIDAGSYSVGGAAGASCAAGTAITGITVVNGIVTAITGTGC